MLYLQSDTARFSPGVCGVTNVIQDMDANLHLQKLKIYVHVRMKCACPHEMEHKIIWDSLNLIYHKYSACDK